MALIIGFLFTAFVGACLILSSGWHGRFSLDGTDGVQKQHTTPTPRIGGIAIFLGALAAYYSADLTIKAILGPMLLACMPAFFSGLVEDFTKKVSVRTRLIATMASGVLAWMLTGIAMQNTGLWGLDHLLTIMPLAVAFTAFVVSGVANSINIIDGFNGLAAGVAAIALAGMGAIAVRVGDDALWHVAFMLCFVALGFCVVNWPGGRIFMGDGGAYLLGFLIAWIAILLPMGGHGVNGWATLLACAYPVLEVLFTIRRRIKRHGHHPGQPDSCHLHHFLHRRVIRKVFPRSTRTVQNALTGSLVWLLAALPTMWAVVFYQNTLALLVGFTLAACTYSAIYARLTQFAWCFQAATMRKRTAFSG